MPRRIPRSPYHGYVFVSFASEDIELARHAVQRLETAGLRCCFSERDIEAANASPHVLREVELAFNAGTAILPVRMSGVLPSSDLQSPPTPPSSRNRWR